MRGRSVSIKNRFKRKKSLTDGGVGPAKFKEPSLIIHHTFEGNTQASAKTPSLPNKAKLSSLTHTPGKYLLTIPTLDQLSIYYRNWNRTYFCTSSECPFTCYQIRFYFCLTVLKMNSFVCFLEEFEDTKSPFEINWPLVFTKFHKSLRFVTYCTAYGAERLFSLVNHVLIHFSLPLIRAL